MNTAVFHATYGDPATALEETEVRLREPEHLPRERWVHNYMTLARVLALWADGRIAECRELGRELLPLVLEQEDTMSLSATLEFLSWGACTEQEHAALLLGGAATLWRQVGTALWGVRGLQVRHTEIENALMLNLGTARFTQVYTHGTRLRAPALVDIAQSARNGAGMPAPPADDTNALPPRTPREREVVGLIAEGLTNRQIAERLVISTRTADTHVVRILTKLGVTSRTQIAEAMGAEEPPRSEQ
ncbi:helix-turn-helix transcriptional regulator [Streptomyces tendae]|uniref:helix-turn-helix transcriptional regulator n=1 Tax=Streptomyces tendae TaxID=1932 RepID=UPI0024915167|nr:helix-turn-helix transcriptional regulator [Streptomyces tendae]